VRVTRGGLGMSDGTKNDLTETKKITLPALIESVTRITEFSETEMEMHECPMKVIVQMNIAIDEIVSNVVNYAYGDEKGDVSVSLDFLDSPRAVRMTFRDKGNPYNPLKNADPDITLSAEERNIGGLGIFIVKKNMDSMEYAFEDGENVLTITKLY